MTDATKIDRDALMEAIGSALGDALLCSRVWEAWQHKTMTEDDFSPAAEDDDYVAGFTDAVIAHLSTPPVEPEVEEVDPEPWVHPTHGRAHMPHAGTGWLHAPRKVVPHE